MRAVGITVVAGLALSCSESTPPRPAGRYDLPGASTSLEVRPVTPPAVSPAAQAPAQVSPSGPPFAFTAARALRLPVGTYNVMPGFALLDLDGDGDLDLLWPC